MAVGVGSGGAAHEGETDRMRCGMRMPGLLCATNDMLEHTVLAGDMEGIWMDDGEQGNWVNWFRLMALMSVRNTRIEAIHVGVAPVSRRGDFSDVTVVDADGRRIPWPEVSHFDDGEIKDLMRQIVNRLYTFHAKAGDPDFQCILDRWMPVARGWDEPE